MNEGIFHGLSNSNTRSNSTPTSLVFSTVTRTTFDKIYFSFFNQKVGILNDRTNWSPSFSEHARHAFRLKYNLFERFSTNTEDFIINRSSSNSSNNNRHTIRLTRAQKSNFSLQFSLLHWHRR